MIKITSEEEKDLLADGNKIEGFFPKLTRSNIVFKGKNNILYCEKNVELKNSTINFNGDNSLVYLSENPQADHIIVSCYTDCVFHLGSRTRTHKVVPLNIILSEHGTFFIGDDCTFSLNIYVRNSDVHLIYDTKTRRRSNRSRSIYIGDHVWVCQNVLIMKGTQIDSGSVVGAGCLLAGTKVPHNTAYGGNPAKRLKKNIFWDLESSHNWTAEQTNAFEDYNNLNRATKDAWIYQYSVKEKLDFEEIERNLANCKSSNERLEYILRINADKTKNRFVHTK